VTDADPTPQQPSQEGGGESRSERPKRLVRSRDRMLAGVASGLGEYFNVDPAIFRIGFALSIFVGGLGILAYVALALLLPERGEREGEELPPLIQRSRPLAIAAGVFALIVALSWGAVSFDPWPFDRGGAGWVFGGPLLFFALLAGAYIVARGLKGSAGGGWLGLLLVGTIAFFGLSILAVCAAWVAAVGHGAAIAGAIIAIGVMLVVAAFAGGGRWLIVPALALAVPLAFVAATDVSFGGGIGERVYRPASAEVLPADGRYELGVGRLVVDLRELDWEPGDVVEVELDLGLGEGVVAVPETVCVAADLRARMGVVSAAGDESDGFDAESTLNLGTGVTPRLELRGEVDAGRLELVNDDTADVDEHGPDGFRWHDDDDELAAERMREACDPDRQALPQADADDATTDGAAGERSDSAPDAGASGLREEGSGR